MIMIQEMKFNTYTTQPMKGNFEPCPQCESPVEEVSGVIAEIEDMEMYPRLVDRYNQLTGFTLIPCGCYLDSYAYTLVIMPELPGQWIASQQLDEFLRGDSKK